MCTLNAAGRPLVIEDEPETEHILLFIIGGDAPQAEFTTQAKAAIEEWGAEVS